MASESNFKLTYATMFNPPEELHQRFDEALAKLRANLGQEYAMIIDGKEVFATEKLEDRNPANTDEVLGIFQKGTADDANAAVLLPVKHSKVGAILPGRNVSAWCAKPPRSWTTASLRWALLSPWKWARTAWKRWATWPKPLT